MSKNTTLSTAKSAKNDEFYTQYGDMHRGDAADIKNCQMHCKTHNRTKANS